MWRGIFFFLSSVVATPCRKAEVGASKQRGGYHAAPTRARSTRCNRLIRCINQAQGIVKRGYTLNLFIRGSKGQLCGYLVDNLLKGKISLPGIFRVWP